MPISGKIIHGRRKRAVSIKLTGLIREAESLVEKVRVVLADGMAPDLVLIAHCSECEFEARCRNKAVENDNLSLLGGMKSNEIKASETRYIYSHTVILHISSSKEIETVKQQDSGSATPIVHISTGLPGKSAAVCDS